MGNESVIKKGSPYKIGVLLFLGLLACLVWPRLLQAADGYTTQTIPNVHLTDRTQYVSNPDGIIDPQDVDRINQLLRTIEDSLGIEVAVVAVNNIGDAEPRMFANELFKQWGIGKKGKDNGLLMQLVTAPGKRSIVFETGYGLEGILPDAVCSRLQQKYMIPDLKAGRYSQAMVSGVAAVKNYLMANDHDRAALTGLPTDSHDSFMKNALLAALLLFFFVLVLVLFTYRRYPTRVCPRCGKKTLKYAGQQVIQDATNRTQGLVEDVYRCTNCGYTEHNNRHTYNRRSSLFPFIIGAGLGGFGRGWGGGFGGGIGGGGGAWGGGASGGGGAIGRF